MVIKRQPLLSTRAVSTNRFSTKALKTKTRLVKKKNFILRIDEATYEQLRKWADDDFRSVNGQVEYLLNKALKEAGRKPKTKKPPSSS